MSQRRVVVTGLGLVTPLGVGVKTAWKNLINGHCGIVSLADRTGFEKLPVRIAAEVPQGSYEDGKFTASEWLDRGVRVHILESSGAHYCYIGRSHHGEVFSLRDRRCSTSH